MAVTGATYERTRTERLGLLLTVTQAAGLLAVSRATVYRLIGDGELPPIRVRSHVRILESDLRGLIERRRAEGAAL